MTELNTTDPTEIRAHEMRQALIDLGIRCDIHWDRSPWGVRIELTEISDDARTGDTHYENPTLYVMTEGTSTVAGFDDVWTWVGALGGFGDDADMNLSDTTFNWIERHWMGHGVASVAQMVAQIVPILRFGAAGPEGLNESTCTKCGETYNPLGSWIEPHGAREDGEVCGGMGTAQGAWSA